VLLRTHEWNEDIVDRLQGIERRKGGLGRSRRS
jgi:hypothetical protein